MRPFDDEALRLLIVHERGVAFGALALLLLVLARSFGLLPLGGQLGEADAASIEWAKMLTR